MFKYCFLFFTLCLATSLAFGQGTVKGRVFEVKTRITLADIQVQNLTNQQSTTTDDKGRFTITAKTGDLLLFKGFAYNADTVLLTDTRNLEVFLIPHQNFLDEVKVTTDSTKNMNTYYDPRFHGQTVIYSHDADLNYTGGITIRVWDSKKDQHKREHLQNELKDQQVQDEINKVFTPVNVGKYIPLKGKEMDEYLVLYTPETTVYANPDFRLAVYLSDCYQKFLKLPEDKRHPQQLDTLSKP